MDDGREECSDACGSWMVLVSCVCVVTVFMCDSLSLSLSVCVHIYDRTVLCSGRTRDRQMEIQWQIRTARKFTTSVIISTVAVLEQQQIRRP